MNCEESRLRTFDKWPSNAGVDPRKIAKAGFYYMGQGVEVECFSCGGRISDWNYGDRVVAVITRHKLLDPSCPFIKDPQASGNIPLSSSQPPRNVRDPNESTRANDCGSSRVSEPHPDSSRTSESVPDSTSRQSDSSWFNLSDKSRLPSLCRSRNSNTQREVYQSESSRLESFSNWPLPYISPQQLAKAGFFYTGRSDKVECYFCETELDSWEEGDSPMEEHRRHFPTCPFLVSLDCGVHVRNSTTDSAPFNGEYESLKDLGVHKHRVPRSPKYSTYEARIRSFKNWPPTIPQKPRQLSDAGFYFTGRGDQVRCFHCDGGLRLWEAGDEPWEEHARWFSDCGFLFLVRGQQFIDQVLDSLRSHQPLSMRVESRGVKRKQQSKVRAVSEEELHAAMSSPHALAALEIGVEAHRVKQALKQRLETCGDTFTRSEDLISAAFTVQNEEDSDGDDVWSVTSTCITSLLQHAFRRGTPPNSPAIFGKSRVSPRRDCLRRQGSSNSYTSSPSRESSVPANSTPHTLDTDQRFKPDSLSPSSSSDSLTKKSECAEPSCTSARVSDHSSSPVKSVGELKDEIKRLKEWRQCKVCMDNEVGVVLLPCGHLVTCVLCTHSISDCPLCRQSIQATVRTFLS